MWKADPRIAKIILRNNKIGDITLPNIKTYKYSNKNIWYNTCGGKK